MSLLKVFDLHRAVSSVAIQLKAEYMYPSIKTSSFVSGYRAQRTMMMSSWYPETNIYVEDIMRWREDMNFIFEWPYFTNERSE